MEALVPSKTMVAVVDSDVWVVRTVSDALSGRGFRVLAFTSSSSASQNLTGAKCDVLVIREDMTQMSGSELCATLRRDMGESRPGFVRLFQRPQADGEDTGSEYDSSVTMPLQIDELLDAVTRAVCARPNAVEVSVPVPPDPSEKRRR